MHLGFFSLLCIGTIKLSWKQSLVYPEILSSSNAKNEVDIYWLCFYWYLFGLYTFMGLGTLEAGNFISGEECCSSLVHRSVRTCYYWRKVPTLISL